MGELALGSGQSYCHFLRIYLAPKENTKVVVLYICMWDFFFAKGIGGSVGEGWSSRGVDLFFSNSQREELSTAHMPMPK